MVAPTAPLSFGVSDSAAGCQIQTGFSRGWANLRAGPGMGFQVTATLPDSTKLQVLGEEGDFYTTGIWYQVLALDNTQGWIFNRLCNHGDENEQ
jgi:uncharacterized protein YgiM (DUF1202 family)